MHKIQMPPALEKRFEEVAGKYHISKDGYWLQFLEFFEEFLDDAEDYFYALEAFQSFERGEEKTIPFEEISKKHGLDKESKNSSD